MKRILITLSILANLALGLWLASPSTFHRLAPFTAPEPGGATPGAARTAARSRGEAVNPAMMTPSFREALARATPDELFRQLADSGLPVNLRRAILSGQFYSVHTARRLEMLASLPELPYWQNQGSSGLAPEQNAELRKLAFDFSQQMARLFGTTPPEGLARFSMGSQYGSLPAEKAAQVQSINADYNDVRNQVLGSDQYGTYASMILLPEERNRLAFLDQEKDKDLRAMMTPEEYEDFTFRTSTSGNTLRNSLQFFEPTEAEFRTLFALQREFDLKYNSANQAVFNPVLSSERSQAQQQLNAAMKAAIDPARLADYERTTDSGYRQIAQLAPRIELAPAAITPIWNLQREIQGRASAIRGDRTLTPAARNEQLASLQAEATEKLGAALGTPRNFETYKVGPGSWIQTLVPPPPGGAPAAALERALLLQSVGLMP